MWLFFSHFYFDFDLQSNFLEFTLKFCILSCHLISNWGHFSSKIAKFCVNLSNVISFSPIFTSISIFNRIFLNSISNSPFSAVVSHLIEWIFSCKIVKFLQILQTFSFKCPFFPLFLRFSLRFRSSIEFHWIHLEILHFLLRFQFWFSEFFPLKLWNFESIGQILSLKSSFIFFFFSHFHFDSSLQ